MEVTLRKYQLSDVVDFMGWACYPEVLQHSGLRHWIHHNSTKEDIEKYFSQVVIPHPWFRAICLNNKPIGFIFVEPVGAEKQARSRAIVGAALGCNYWSRGIMEFALRRAVSEAFEENPHLNRIEATALPENKAA